MGQIQKKKYLEEDKSLCTGLNSILNRKENVPADLYPIIVERAKEKYYVKQRINYNSLDTCKRDQKFLKLARSW